MRPAPLAAALAVALLAPAALAASGTYVALGGDLTAVCTTDEGGPPVNVGPDLGGSCDFPVPDGVAEADVEIRDDVTDPTGGYYRFDDAAGDDVGSGAFCGNVTAAVPGEAVTLDVFVDNAFGPLHCPGSAGTGTAGEVVVTWS